MQRGNESEENTGQEREPNSETKNLPVERNLEHAREKVFGHLLEQIESPDRQQNTEQARQSRGQNALSEKLENNTGPGCAKGSANRNFLTSRREAGEEEIGHVRASNKKHTADGGEEGQEHGPLPTDQIFMKLHHAHAGL